MDEFPCSDCDKPGEDRHGTYLCIRCLYDRWNAEWDKRRTQSCRFCDADITVPLEYDKQTNAHHFKVGNDDLTNWLYPCPQCHHPAGLRERVLSSLERQQELWSNPESMKHYMLTNPLPGGFSLEED